MPHKIHWTETADSRLRRLRAQGVDWQSIAAALRLSRSYVIRHGTRIGARGPRPAAAPRPEFISAARPPLRAGHPRSWGPITAGTLLAGTPYPWPPVLDAERPGWARATPVRLPPRPLRPRRFAAAGAPGRGPGPRAREA